MANQSWLAVAVCVSLAGTSWHVQEADEKVSATGALCI